MTGSASYRNRTCSVLHSLAATNQKRGVRSECTKTHELTFSGPAASGNGQRPVQKELAGVAARQSSGSLPPQPCVRLLKLHAV